MGQEEAKVGAGVEVEVDLEVEEANTYQGFVMMMMIVVHLLIQMHQARKFWALQKQMMMTMTKMQPLSLRNCCFQRMNSSIEGNKLCLRIVQCILASRVLCGVPREVRRPFSCRPCAGCTVRQDPNLKFNQRLRLISYLAKKNFFNNSGSTAKSFMLEVGRFYSQFV